MKIGISNFALKTVSDPESLISQVRENWEKRKPGLGRFNLNEVVIVPIHPISHTVRNVVISEDMLFEAYLTRREDGEDPFIAVRAIGYKPRGIRWLLCKLGLAKPKPILPQPASYVNVVLYSAATLLENEGTRSGDYDWEVVAVVASDVENEPMMPLTMARNYLEKPGGTFCSYSTPQFASAIYYHSQRVSIA